MAFHPTAFKRLLFITLLAGVTLSRSWGQAVDSPIKFADLGAITVTLVEPPSLGQSNTPRGEAGLWLKVDYMFAVKPTGAKPFLDAVTFNITIEGRDLYATDATSAEGVPVGLTGTETYVNVAAGREIHGVFYLHPSTMVRYSTKSGPRDFTSRFNIHLDAMVDGKLADYYNLKNEKDLNWYKEASTDNPAGLRLVSGLVYRQDQCCFIVNDPSFYPQLKPQPAAK